MIDLAKIYYIIFGVFTIIGGFMGFTKKSSYASLIAGGLAGVLLLIAALLLREKPQSGLILGGLASLALAGWALQNILHKFKWMPHGSILVLAVIGLIVTLLGFVARR